MPTPLDRATNSRAPFFAFAAIVTGVAAWSIWGGDIFPSSDPTGDPTNWTHEEATRWLNNRNLHPSPLATTAELVERVKANMRVDRK
ncbi:hypothetical protein GQ43DRAFT_440214 [Delitschia confertaspora ATCC 74209]|uniref:Uncharacterized protein n=1 Tax=Delitschia confertaspora ATCC 74209 TaxID=1513339 RepID=A0A9P4MQI6_9PLEO|nr:hypothetical protein GQ43DRAFT_440214 [Delitschia confertaspora ATCC 74209]